MSLLADWQAAVKAQLDTELQAGAFTVEDGERDGPSKDRKLACVFGDGMPTDSNPNYCRPRLVIRAWLPKPKQPQATVPRDTTPLDTLLEDVLVALEPIRMLPDIDGGRGVYAANLESRVDRDDWGVEVALTGWSTNPATIT